MGIIALFIIGLVGMLTQDASQLIKSILGTVLIVGIISGAFYLFLRSKKSTDEKKYARALRKTQKSTQAKATAQSMAADKLANTQKKKNVLPLRKSRKSNHLYVIKGKKSKKKA